MFTGIVQDIGVLEKIEFTESLARLSINTKLSLESVLLGASIACDGCCLTVTSIEGQIFSVDVSHETLDKTTLKNWEAGYEINLEPALKLGDELGGHIVLGHVDGVAELLSCTADGESFRLTFEVSDELSYFVAPKGSVCLNGISLTVNEVSDRTFGVNIIPYTWEHTNLSNLTSGDIVNLEIDVLSRYIKRMLEKSSALKT
jgi:riboflavin synthase